jgi:hypothetical protein
VNPLAKLRGVFAHNRKAVVIAGAGGAAGLALLARKRAGGDPSKRPAPAGADPEAQAATTGMGYESVANELFRSINPTLTDMQRQIAALQAGANPSAATSDLTTANAKIAQLQHVAHARHVSIDRLRRQAVVRADPSQVRNAADRALLTPAARRNFDRFIAAQRATPVRAKAYTASRVPAAATPTNRATIQPVGRPRVAKV